MPRKPDERITQAKELYLKGQKLIEIASQLGVPEGTVRSWKNRYKWDCNVAKEKRNVAKAKKGGQPGNKNAVGGKGGAAPKQNKNAEKHGFFPKKPFLLSRTSRRKILLIFSGRTYRLLMQPS